ncbi:MAG: hypothetical protein ABI175_24820 [Polyangiales bacterium]
MGLRVSIDDVTFDEETDFAGFVRDLLSGRVTTGVNVWKDRFHLTALLRIHERLEAGPLAASLQRGVIACLDDQNPLVRVQALAFLAEHLPSGDAEVDRVLDVIGSKPELFAGIPHPMQTGRDLEWEALKLVGHLAAHSARALDRAQAEALRPGKAMAFLPELVAIDPEWVVEHAEAIVRATPQTFMPLLMLLKKHGQNVTELCEQLAPLGLLPQGEFAEAIESHVLDPVTWHRIRRAVPSTS